LPTLTITTNEVQQIDFDPTTTGGTFTLTATPVGKPALLAGPITFAGVGGGATTATNIQAALNAFGIFGAGGTTVTNVSDFRFTVAFGASAQGYNVPTLSVAAADNALA